MMVVAAALIERDGKLLLAQRPRGHHAGCWELPGGKLEPRESPSAALARELLEELGAQMTRAEPEGFAYQSEDKPAVLLLLFRCEVDGAIVPAEGQAVAWVTLAEALLYDLAPLDRELLARRATS